MICAASPAYPHFKGSASAGGDGGGGDHDDDDDGDHDDDHDGDDLDYDDMMMIKHDLDHHHDNQARRSGAFRL